MTIIVVLGRSRIAADHIDEALAISREHVARSRAEPGCVAHAVHRDAEDPLALVFVERWSDLPALQAHFRVPASRAFAKRLATIAAEPPSMELFEARLVSPRG